MKSVGEAMAIGQNFKESLQKAIRPSKSNRYSSITKHIKANSQMSN